MRRVANRFLEGGVEHALSEESRRRRSKLLDSAQTAALIAMVCGPPPEGRARWTIALVADEVERRSRPASCPGNAPAATASQRSRRSELAYGSGTQLQTELAARTTGRSPFATPSESSDPTGSTESCQSTRTRCSARSSTRATRRG
ncbi:helix-turn-helix domain-containing protein [Sorangium sp. So ce726]|uniref:helix-turn-helix domain-containing protein n=1 Tax=Sorangium sp. So ce726 TaxID=3133319 RepID=UPI003F642C86